MSESNYDKIAQEQAEQAIASRKIFNSLYPPPVKTEVDTNDQKSTMDKLWITYASAVTYSSTHTVPSLMKRASADEIALGITWQHIAAFSAFLTLELSLILIPYIFFRYLIDSQEDGVRARRFMKYSFGVSMCLVFLVLVILNIYSTVEPSTEPTIASMKASATDSSEDKEMWGFIAFVPVVIAFASGLGLALMRSSQKSVEVANDRKNEREVSEHNAHFRKWNAMQQKNRRGAYSEEAVQTTRRSHKTPQNGFHEAVEGITDGRGRLLSVTYSPDTGCSVCGKTMSRAGWSKHKCRFPKGGI